MVADKEATVCLVDGFDEATVREALRDYHEATKRYEECRKMSDEASRDRAAAVARMNNAGLSYDEIGKLLRMSTPRVGQLVSKSRGTVSRKDPTITARLLALRDEAEQAQAASISEDMSTPASDKID
jgi:DNA-directed RNA polymerase specialized sigma24 family protein